MKLLLAVIALDMTILTGIEVYNFYQSFGMQGELSLELRPAPRPTVDWGPGSQPEVLRQ